MPRDIWQTLVPSAQTSQQGGYVQLSNFDHSQKICSLQCPLSPSLKATFLKKSIFCIIIAIGFFSFFFFCYLYSGHQAC